MATSGVTLLDLDQRNCRSVHFSEALVIVDEGLVSFHSTIALVDGWS